MKRSLFLLLAIAGAGVIATASSARGHSASKPHKGALHVTKTCGDYHGAVGQFCTIESSNIDVFEHGMQVVYLQALAPDGTLDSDLVISAGHGSMTVGHVVLNATTKHITFLGGTGDFAGFHADAAVSVVGPGSGTGTGPTASVRTTSRRSSRTRLAPLCSGHPGKDARARR